MDESCEVRRITGEKLWDITKITVGKVGGRENCGR